MNKVWKSSFNEQFRSAKDRERKWMFCSDVLLKQSARNFFQQKYVHVQFFLAAIFGSMFPCSFSCQKSLIGKVYQVLVALSSFLMKIDLFALIWWSVSYFWGILVSFCANCWSIVMFYYVYLILKRGLTISGNWLKFFLLPFDNSLNFSLMLSTFISMKITKNEFVRNSFLPFDFLWF